MINNLIQQKYIDNTLKVKLLLVLYVIGFGIGTTTHTIDIINEGFFPYKKVPDWKNIYWTSLTILDFMVIILIFKSTILALILANFIMVSDVLINTNSFTYFGNYRVILQIIFGLIVLITTPIIIQDMITNIKTTAHNK